MSARSLAKYLIREMAMDLGGGPEPESKVRRDIEGETHAFASNPAWPKEFKEGGFENYAEFVASDQYAKLVNKLSRLLNVPASRVGRGQYSLMSLVFKAVGEARSFERAHKRELEAAAVDIVLSLPEFESARVAYMEDDLRIRVSLVNSVATEGGEPEADPQAMAQADVQVAQIASELGLEKSKRRMMNLLIQGAALDKNFLHEKMSDILNRIHPGLMNAYSVTMAATETLYWMRSDAQHKSMYDMAKASGSGAFGKTRFYVDSDGVGVVEAQAVVLPVLIQELVKGLMERVSYAGDEEDPETMEHVYSQEDTLENETWDIRLGPSVWRQVEKTVGPGNEKYLPYLQNHLARLRPGEFNEIVPEIFKSSPKGKRYVADLIQGWRAAESAV